MTSSSRAPRAISRHRSLLSLHRTLTLLGKLAALCVTLFVAGYNKARPEDEKADELLTIRKTAMKAVFILVRDYPEHYEYCGTGFFISGDGYFLTAAHIIEKDPSVPYFAILDAERPDELCPIEIVMQFPQQDCVLARVKRAAGEFLELADDLPAPNSAIIVVGYSGRIGNTLRIGSMSGRYVGDILEFNIPAKPPYSAKSFPAIVTAPSLSEGFSGGPILNEKLKVIGLHSNNNEDENLLRVLRSHKPVAVSVSLDLLIKAKALAAQRK